MKKFLLIPVFLFYSNTFAQVDQSTYYISPGIGISSDFKSSIILELKVSLGRMVSEEYYYSINLGKKFVLRSKSNIFYPQHVYVDLQVGSFFNYYPFSVGVGIGTAIITKNKKYKIYPRCSIFAGAGLFLTFDYIYKKHLIDLGLQAVFPIPFDKDYRDLKP